MSADHTLRDDCPDPSCRMGHGDGTSGPTCETCGGTGWVVKTMDDLRDEVEQLREDASAMVEGSEWQRTTRAKADRLEALVEMWCGGMVAEAAE